MASFTDNILTFNPYLSQMPVIDDDRRHGADALPDVKLRLRTHLIGVLVRA
jgi:hypothetical protein